MNYCTCFDSPAPVNGRCPECGLRRKPMREEQDAAPVGAGKEQR